MKIPSKPEVRISIITNKEINEPDFLRQFFDELSNPSYKLTPEYADNSGERMNRQYISLADSLPIFTATISMTIDGITSASPTSFYWKKKSLPKFMGSIYPTRTTLRGDIRPGWILLKSDIKCCPEWGELFRKLVLISDAYYGTMHLFTNIELDIGRHATEDVENFGFDDHSNGLPSAALEERGLANLSWANYFGEGLSHLVDQSAIQAAGYDVKLVNGYPLVTLTPDILDVQRDLHGFFARRSALKKLFEAGTFRVESEPTIYPTDS